MPSPQSRYDYHLDYMRVRGVVEKFSTGAYNMLPDLNYSTKTKTNRAYGGCLHPSSTTEDAALGTALRGWQPASPVTKARPRCCQPCCCQPPRRGPHLG